MPTLEATLDSLLAEICASPADDLPRLAYADLCEEMGNLERADFIRLQLRMAKTPPGSPLYDWMTSSCMVQLENWHTSWFDSCGLMSSDVDYKWRRGFVNHVKLESWDWLSKHRRLLASNPITEVVLTTLPEVGICMDDAGLWCSTFIDAGELETWHDLNYGVRPDRLQAVKGLLRTNWPRIRFLSCPPGPGSYMPILTEGSDGG